MNKYVLFLVVLFFIGCSNGHSETQENELKKVYSNYYEERLKLFPTEATAIGDHRFDDQFENEISSAHREAQKKLYNKYLEISKKYNYENLSKKEKLNLELFVYHLKSRLSLLDYPDHLLPVSHSFSVPSAFIQYGSGAGDHEFKTVKNYYDFLKRIDGFSEWVNTAISNMDEGIKANIVQPKIIVQHTIKQFKPIIVEDIEKSSFYNPIKNIPDEFSKEEKEEIKEKYKSAISNKIFPIYKKLTEYLENIYLPAANEKIGLSKYANGKKWYEERIRFFTTTNLTADEIFNLGEKEVKRIEDLMKNLLKENGFENNLGGFFQEQRQNGNLSGYSTEENIITAYNKLREKITPKLKNYFGKIPKADFEIRPIEAYRAATASDSYSASSPDGSRPGVFYLNTYGIEQRPKNVLESLFLHEAIPGHHYQIALTREMESLPNFRKYNHFTAYVEGWGLYAESLGKELGLYKSPAQEYIRYLFEMIRATRLVVDIGIHSKGWSRQQSIDYLSEKNPATAARAPSAVDRYISNPGQALAYKIGELKIHEIKNIWKEKLGDNFKVKTFHDKILGEGSLPLNILENYMLNEIGQ